MDAVYPVTGGVHYPGQVLAAGPAPRLVLGESDVRPHSSVVDRLARSEVVPQRRLLHDGAVPLPQLVEHLHLLPADVQGFVHHDPGDGLPAAGVGGAALVGDVVPRVGQEAGQGDLVQPSSVPPVLDLAQPRH